MPQSGITPEAQRCYEKAHDLWGEATIGELDNGKKRDIAALLALAIKKAGTPFPRAEADLSLFLFFLDDTKEAQKHADAALRHDADSFMAQWVRVGNALNNLKVKKLNAGSFFADGGSIEGSVIASGIAAYFNLMGAVVASSTQTMCKKEIAKLVEIYHRACKKTSDVDEFVQMSDLLVSLGDFISDIPFAGGRPNLFSEVARAPIAHLDMAGREEDIQDMRLKAEGKAELFRPK